MKTIDSDDLDLLALDKMLGLAEAEAIVAEDQGPIRRSAGWKPNGRRRMTLRAFKAWRSGHYREG